MEVGVVWKKIIKEKHWFLALDDEIISYNDIAPFFPILVNCEVLQNLRTKIRMYTQNC